MGFLYSQFFITPPPPTTPFTNQTIIVTGSNSGLGLEAARHFTRLNAQRVILAVRNTSAGEEAKSSIETSTGRTGVCEVWHLDLASFDSVKQFAQRVNDELERLDVVVENAGYATRNLELAEGFETTITINVINTFLLALLLLPKLRGTAERFPDATRGPPRLSIVSSEVHAWVQFPETETDNLKNETVFKTLSNPETSNMNSRYGTSKLLEVLLVRELAPKLTKSGNNVILNVLNPGFCHSQLTRKMAGLEALAMTVFKSLVARSTEVGSRTLVAAALAGEESHGKYMTDGVVDESAASGFARSEEGALWGRRVWEELRGILEGVSPGVTGVVGG